jgi:ATP-dependent protease ClpP protease subunit
MNTDKLKYVVGAVKANEPAYMRIYGHIDEYLTRNFNDEFLWLQDYIKPSKIVISINSEGGSVLHGMGTYSIIQNSPIETETIIEGLAASMASVLWAAGTRSYMRDYSILMIHNPFMQTKKTEDGCQVKDEDPDTNQMLDAFRKQIETVYTKRFGLSKAKVREIMEGAEGCDGTYFDAKQAVEAGIIPAENVIKTSKQVCTKVKDSIKGVEEACAIQEIMASINTELGDIKPLDNSSSIPNQNQINNSISKNMDKEQEFAFGSVCAQLGLDKSSEVSAVINRVTALMDAEKKVKDVQSQYDALKIEKAGVDAQLVNAKKELADANAKLKTYQDAEKAQHDAEVAKFIEDAIADGKITAESKETWVAMAATNFEVVKATLNSIEKRDKITDKIATDPANVNDAANAMTEAEKKMAEAVDNVVGKDFEFKTLD